MLLGGWDEAFLGDRQIIEALAETSYENVLARLTPLLSRSDSPLRKAGSAWKIASPRDSWFRLAKFITTSDLQRFEIAAGDVLGASDPRFDLKPDERWLAPIRGQQPKYSGLIRTSVSEVLVLLGTFGAQITAVVNASGSAEAIVRGLLKHADAPRWWSLSRELPALAEASPEAFLEAVEESLSIEDRPIRSLFGERDGGIFGSEHQSGLLWALETLAWNPNYLAPVTELLARLATLDPGGRYSNRPDRSLRNIFLLWCPQCSVPLIERLKVLKRLRQVDSNVSWKLMLALMPTPHEHLIPAALPRWRDFPVTPDEQITYQLIGEGATQIGDWLLEEIGTEPGRWTELLDRMSNLPPKIRQKAITQLAESTPKFRVASDRLVVQKALRHLVNHHRSFQGAAWALPENELKELEALYITLEPADAVQRVRWLFDDQIAKRVNVQGRDWDKDLAESNKARQEAVALVLKEQGPDGIFALANFAKLPALIGQAVHLTCRASVLDHIFLRAIKSETHAGWNLHMA